MRYFFIFGIFLVIFGVVFVVLGFKEGGVSSESSQTPEEISLKELIARGPNGNPNVIVTDFILCENFVYKTDHGRWSGAWIPAVPADSLTPGQKRGGSPTKIQALIFTINAQSDAELNQRCNQPKLRALVVNKITSIGAQEKSLLQNAYPGTDFAQCLIIQEGREPAGKVKLFLMLGGGGIATFIGFALLGVGTFLWMRQGSLRSRKKLKQEDDKAEEEEEPRARRIKRSRVDDE
jgi:hypothetical protein